MLGPGRTGSLCKQGLKLDPTSEKAILVCESAKH